MTSPHKRLPTQAGARQAQCAFTAYITHAAIGSVLPTGTMAKPLAAICWLVVFRLQSNQPCCRTVVMHVAVTLIAEIGSPAARARQAEEAPAASGCMQGMIRLAAHLGSGPGEADLG